MSVVVVMAKKGDNDNVEVLSGSSETEDNIY